MAFPHFHHPEDWHLHSGSRNYFASYGTLGNFYAYDGVDAGEVATQRLMPSSDVNHLYATSPTLPLTPANHEADSGKLPMGTSREYKNKLQVFLKSFSMTRSQIQSKRYAANLAEAKRYLAKLERDGQLDRRMRELPRYMQQSFTTFEAITKQLGSHNVNSELLVGNCLSTHQSRNEETTLCYVSGSNMETLCIDRVEATSQTGDLQISSIHRHDVGRQIHQVGSVAFTDSEWCCVRDADQTVKLLKTTTDGAPMWQEVWQNQWQDKISDVTLSPFISGECVVSLLPGSVILCDSSRPSGTEILLEGLEPRFQVHEHWWRCHYAAHPRQLVVTDGTGVTIYDVRRKQASSEGLFILPNAKLNVNERVQVSAVHPDNAFYHLIATEFSLFLLDQRLPNKPVLNWSHGLQTPPRYLELVANAPPTSRPPTQTVALLSSRDTAEVNCIPFSVAMTPLPPALMDTPWKLSRVNDCLLYGLQPRTSHPLVFEQRLESLLLGVSASYRDNILNAFQLTVHGDVFYQQYSPASSGSQDKTFAAGPGSKDISIPSWCREKWLQWMESISKQTDDKYLRNIDYMAMPQHKGKPCTLIESEYLTIGFESAPYPHILCQLCMSQLQQRLPQQPSTIPDEEDMESECHACGHTLHQAHQLRQMNSPTRVIQHAEVSDDLLAHLPRLAAGSFTDADSQILTALWDEDDPDLTELLQKREGEYKDYKQRRKEKKNASDVPEGGEAEVVESSGETDPEEDVEDSDARLSDDSVDPTQSVTPATKPSHVEGDVVRSGKQPSLPLQSIPSSGASAKDSPQRTPAKKPTEVAETASPSRVRHSSGSSVSSLASSLESFSPGFLLTPTRKRKRRLTSPVHPSSSAAHLFKLPRVTPHPWQRTSLSQPHTSFSVQSPHHSPSPDSHPPHSPSRNLFWQQSPAHDVIKVRHLSQPHERVSPYPHQMSQPAVSFTPQQFELKTLSQSSQILNTSHQEGSPAKKLRRLTDSSKLSSPRSGKKAAGSKRYTMGF